MDYQEWRKKDGTIIVLCSLEELLMNHYEASSLTELLPHVKSSGEYAIKCPFCSKEGYEKEKLYIKDDMTVGHCFKCHRAFMNVTEDIEFTIKTPTIGKSNHHDLVKLSNDTWTLDMYDKEFTENDKIGEKYLASRHKYLPMLSKLLKFKFSNHNVVMPFFFHGELIYYQIRFTNKNPIRYFFPPITDKPIYAIECNDCKDLVICEGIFDAIGILLMYPDKTPIAVLGSTVSDYQIEMIRTYHPRSIKVYMDETKLSIGIIKKLKSVIDYAEYSIVKSNGEDPEEKLIKLINQGKFYINDDQSKY